MDQLNQQNQQNQENRQNQQNPFNDDLATVDVHARIPPFFKASPEIWFMQLQSIFRSSRVTSSAAKFHLVVGSLDTKMLTILQDLLRNPGPTPFETLKARILEEFSDTERQRVQHLLENEQLGDRKPSHFLHHLRALAGNLAADGIMKSLWLRGLPVRVQELLTVVNTDDIDDMARVADKAMEVHPQTTVSAVRTTREASNYDSFLHQEIRALRTQLAALTTKVDALSARVSRSKSRTRSVTPKRSDYCYYHERFGENAHSCRAPCSFPKASTKNASV
jgi:hypothetical protein